MPVSTECAAALLSFRYPSLPCKGERVINNVVKIQSQLLLTALRPPSVCVAVVVIEIRTSIFFTQ